MAARGNQLICLYIFCILRLDASPEQPFSPPMVHRRLMELGIQLDRKTVLNHIKTMSDQFPAPWDSHDSFLGSYLCCTLRRYRRDSRMPDRYIELLPEDETPDGSILYYYIEGDILPEELDLLQSTIEINQYLSAEKTQKMITDIEHLKPFAFRGQSLYTALSGRELKKSPTDIFGNLSVLRDAIRRKQKTAILYGRYDSALNLSPTSQEPRTVNPYAVMSSNGYSYLIAGNPKYDNNLTNFRIDRILEIRILGEGRDPIPQKLAPYFQNASQTVFQAGQYRNDHPVMYSDESVRIHLSCSPSIINNLLDDFGWGIQIRNIPDPEHPDWVHVATRASLLGAAAFCTQYCASCRVLSPSSLQAKVVENLTAGLKLYETSLPPGGEAPGSSTDSSSI